MLGKASAGSIFQKLCNKILQNILLCQKFPYVKVTTTFQFFMPRARGLNVKIMMLCKIFETKKI